MTIEDRFLDAMARSDLHPPGIKADGEIHRFPSSDKRGDSAGWYVLDDGHGAFGCWRTGLTVKWSDKGRSRRTARPRAKVKDDRRQRHADAVRKARWVWDMARPGSHPYLTRKRIRSHGTKVYRDMVVVPMTDSRELRSLQFIGADGSKRFLRGGRVKGCYYRIGDVQAESVICEGFSTGATIREATGRTVYVCFSAGNMTRVARAIQDRKGSLVCADNDTKTKGNPGLAAGREAAKILRARLVFPRFSRQVPTGTDWNDLAAVAGLDEVRRQVGV